MGLNRPSRRAAWQRASRQRLRLARLSLCSTLSAVCWLRPAPDALGDEAPEPAVRPTLAWLAAQAVPSPGIGTGERGAHFGMQWQLTPLLYSWSVREELSPLRYFVVEPNLRQGGSVELYVAPEVHVGTSSFALLRPGVRGYFPLVERGEYLSASFGVSYQRADGHDGAAFEVGTYILYGIIGLQVSYCPAPRTPLSHVATLRLRYF